MTLPPDAVVAHARGLLASRDAEAALRVLLPLAEANPSNPAVLVTTGDAHHIAGHLADAASCYQAAIDLGALEGWRGLGSARLGLGEYGAAVAALRRARVTAETQLWLGSALFQLGRMEEAVSLLQRAASGGDAEVAAVARCNLACIIPGSPAASHADVLAVRRAWLASLDVPHGPARERPQGGKLRIGYLSAFFGARNWMKPVWGVVNHHDRARFEIHLFSDGGDPSAESGYQDCETDHIYQIAGADNATVCEAIGAAGIDVLIDLNGYSQQDRMPVLLARPAPVIAGWFNMFATTGSAAYDWLVGDAAVLRPEEKAFYPEPVHRVPGSYLAFQVTYPTPAVTPPPSIAAGKLTFGCLASQYKLTNGVIAAWGRILHGAPEAALLVRNAALSDASTADDLRARLAAEGIAADRVTLLGRTDHAAFLASYAAVDIALDPFPYNGGTTTTEALWQGVPVLTFDGDRWASRTSRSLLLAAGLEGWVMADADGYVAQAVSLALDPATPQRLAVLRAGMRDRLLASAACDSPGLCRALEAAYEEWAR